MMDLDIDFGAIFSRFETLLIGRRTSAATPAMGAAWGVGCVSHTMRQTDIPDLMIVNDAESSAAELKTKPGNQWRRAGADRWLTWTGGWAVRWLWEYPNAAKEATPSQ